MISETGEARTVPNREALFQTAVDAAEAGNAVGMLDALYQTGILDGIPRYIAATGRTSISPMPQFL